MTARLGCGTVLDMSAIELAPLSDRLDDEEMKSLGRLLEQAGTKLPAQDDHTTHSFAKRLNEEAMTEFLDRLDAHDIGAEIYLPLEFDGPLKVGEFRVASAFSLQETLEEMKEELAIEDEEFEDKEEEEEEDSEEIDEGSVIEAQMRNIWQLVTDACSESIEKNYPLHLRV
ncbi:MAG TPA: hypothetical protein VF550_04935 [Polyangia bacterium]